MLIGAHCGGGVKGALDKAVEIGADAVQLFTQSPRAWKPPAPNPEVYEAFRTRRSRIPLTSRSWTVRKSRPPRITFSWTRLNVRHSEGPSGS